MYSKVLLDSLFDFGLEKQTNKQTNTSCLANVLATG